MKHYKTSGSSYSAWVGMARLLAIFCLVCSWSAEATAPRIAPGLFGEEKKADIVGYQFAPLEASKSDGELPVGKLAVEIVTEAFKAAGKTPLVDVLPSKQLAKYALFNNDAVALMGSPQDLAAKERNQYRVVTFYLRAPADEPVALIFSKARGNVLHQAFNQGLQTIIKSGKYLEILEKYRGKGQVPADYASRLKRHNSSWK